MKKTPRALSLRARPPFIRYAYIAVGETTIHVGLSHSGLAHAMNNDTINALVVVDVERGINYPALAPHFAAWWRLNYLDPEADYESERQ